MARINLFSAATAAASQTFSLAAEERGRIVVHGMASGDTVDLMVPDINGINWEDAYDQNGQIRFSYQVLNTVLIEGPGDYKIDKGSTTGTVAAYLVKGTPR